MKTNLELPTNMIDFAVSMNPFDKRINVINNGEYINVSKIVVKIPSRNLSIEEIEQVKNQKSRQYPQHEIFLMYA